MITRAAKPDQLTEPAHSTHAAPTAPLVLVLHGGRGDLARRLVIPSLATLQHRGLLPAHWALFGTGRDVISTQEYQDVVRDSLTEFGQERTGDADVHDALEEQQVFRIDHFLGKEATQNLHVLRFANELFGAVWNHHHVAQVQIDVPETLDVGQRAEFYDGTGAALDMVVSHLFQVAAEVAMEPPLHLAASHLARAREDALACFRELDVAHDVVLGQFEGYRELKSVAEGSTTDTFIAARLWIDNHRWRGVPFLLRTGKRMAASAQRVTLVLRRDPGSLYGDRVPVGRISVSLAGDGAIEVTAAVKRPGPDLDLELGTARLDLDDVDGEPLPPYASLLDDVLHGDHTLFTTPAGLADAWRAFAPLLGPDRPQVQPYAPGSWGPSAAAELAGPGGWALGGSTDRA